MTFQRSHGDQNVMVIAVFRAKPASLKGPQTSGFLLCILSWKPSASLGESTTMSCWFENEHAWLQTSKSIFSPDSKGSMSLRNLCFCKRTVAQGPGGGCLHTLTLESEGRLEVNESCSRPDASLVPHGWGSCARKTNWKSALWAGTLDGRISSKLQDWFGLQLKLSSDPRPSLNIANE